MAVRAKSHRPPGRDWGLQNRRRPYNGGMIEIRQESGAILLSVKVVPGASRTRLMGELDGRAKVAVAAPPEGGKANKALIAYLADLMGLRKSAVTVESGATSPLKTVRITGADAAQVLRALDVGA